MPMPFERLKTEIEALVDATCADTVKGALAEVCREKADHIRSNWQDNETARGWDALARSIETVPNFGV